MARQRSHSIEFKRQVAQEFIAGESLYALSKRHDISCQLIRVWVEKYEAGASDEDAQAADLLQEYEAKIAALERMVGRQALEIEFLKGAPEKRTTTEKCEYIRHCRPRGVSIAEGCRLMGIGHATFYDTPAAHARDLTIVAEMKAGKVDCNVLEGFVCHQIHSFDLECLHEALGLGVVVGIAAPAHGAGETVILQDGAIVFGGILRPTVRMMHAASWWIAALMAALSATTASRASIERAQWFFRKAQGRDQQQFDASQGELLGPRHCAIGKKAIRCQDERVSLGSIGHLQAAAMSNTHVDACGHSRGTRRNFDVNGLGVSL